MTRSRSIGFGALLVLLGLCACAAAPSRPAAAIAPRTAHASSAPPSSAAPARTTERCDPSRPPIAEFSTDEAVLRAVRGNTPAVPTQTWHEDALRFDLPTAWFPSRRHEGEEVLYHVLTGDPDDVVAIYYAHQPAFRLGDQGGFRMLLGAVAVRGTVTSDATGVRRLEAVAALPCEQRAFVSVWARTRSPERFAAVVDLLRSVTRAPVVPSPLVETTLDATRDRDALRALLHGDALATELVDRSLANGSLRARYPLSVQHPLADQLLSGRFVTPVGGAPTEVSVWLPVRDGRAQASGPYRALHEPTLTRAFAGLLAAGCHATALQLGHDGIALRCSGGRDVRVLADEDTPTLWPDAIESATRLESALDRWSGHADQVGGWPASLCGDGPWVVERAGATDLARSDRCALGIDAATGRIAAAAFAGACASIPSEPWSEPFRRVVRLDEIRGAGSGACTFTLGWNGRSSWALAAGDGGTTSAPIARGPVLAIDRRAVHTAVAFLADLERYAAGRTDEPPANVRPSVLAGLGILSAGDAGARSLARLLRATGAAGPGIAVLFARSLPEDRVIVEFLGLEVELTETPDGWLVTAARPAVNPTPGASH